MSVKDVKYVSPLTGREVSKATYYRHQKKALSQTRKLVDQLDKEYKEESQSQSYDLIFEEETDDGWIEKSQSQSQSQVPVDVFKRLFLAASSRGIPKKIVQECEKFL